jgi:hypothetical protein
MKMISYILDMKSYMMNMVHDEHEPVLCMVYMNSHIMNRNLYTQISTCILKDPIIRQCRMIET